MCDLKSMRWPFRWFNRFANDWWFAAVLLLLLFRPTAYAQTSEYLPEIDTYISLEPDARFNFQAKETREDGIPTQAEIGPSMEFYWRPLKGLVPNGVDEAKTRFILLSFGYHYLPTSNAPATNRILMVATPRFPLKSKLVISDRNRGELNFSNGGLTWRYRNRLQLEREITIRHYHPTPYANIEVYYNSMFQKWSTTAIEAGSQFPFPRHYEILVYYEHQNNTGTPHNQQVNAIGTILNLHF
jgi:Protein of unknown function (DUF2490)